MKSYRLILLFVLSLVIISCNGCGSDSSNPFYATPTPYYPTPTPITGSYTVNGTITSAYYSSPLNNAYLTITSPNGYYNTTNANQQGQFTFTNLQGGDYLIRVTQNGYITMNNYVTVPAIPDNTGGSSYFNWSLWTINDWNSTYPDHQYSTQSGYIKVSVIRFSQNNLGTIINHVDGASVTCNPNSYYSLGYMTDFNSPPTINWNTNYTTSAGDALFYRVDSGSNLYTLSATKQGYTFNQAINCSSNAGEISTVIITQQ